MTSWRWVLHDPDDAEMRASEDFASKEEAEAWMGAEWKALLDEGAESVSLMEGERREYKMGLREA